MVVLVTLVRVLGAVMVAVVRLVIMIAMAVIVTTAAIRAMGVGVVRVIIALVLLVVMPMAMVVVSMIMAGVSVPLVVMSVAMIVPAAAGCVMRVIMIMTVCMVVVVTVIIGAALGLERTFDHAHGAALAANHLGEDMVVLDIDRVCRDLRRRVPVADMPGDTHQPQRVLGPHFEQALRSGLDQDEAAILELHRIAIVQDRRLVEIEQDLAAAIAFQGDAAAIAVLMVERQGLNDLVLLDRGLADDGGGAQHDSTRDNEMDQRRSTDRGSTTSITGGAVTQAPAISRNA
ncbi:hypothetical protein FG93_05554 [Bosea sp. LC85]|nr:hypothetical protein FG93_05554 [Bosea sp. LC85]